jgi:hypothetical protein
MAVTYELFSAEALGANQSGRLTDAQRRYLRGMARSVRKGEFTFALPLLAIGILVFIADGHRSSGTERYLIGLAFVAMAIFLVARALTGGDALTRDLRRVRVESVEGAIAKHIQQASGTNSDFHYLDVAGKRFEVPPSAYQAAPDAGYVRVYFLPRSHKVVNLERLPDRSLPADATPKDLMTAMGAAMHSHSETRIAEARADIASFGEAVTAGFSRTAVPPPLESRDPRPLTEALPGTWSSMLMTLTFASNGTVSGTMMSGRQHSGHWSVDSTGRLRTDVTGHDGAADAWIVGDQLTIALQGEAFTFHREPGG